VQPDLPSSLQSNVASAATRPSINDPNPAAIQSPQPSNGSAASSGLFASTPPPPRPAAAPGDAPAAPPSATSDPASGRHSGPIDSSPPAQTSPSAERQHQEPAVRPRRAGRHRRIASQGPESIGRNGTGGLA
jgi:hypothetical protein